MAIEATFTTTDGEYPLAAVFSEFPDAEIEQNSVSGRQMYHRVFQARAVEIEHISMGKVTHPGIHDNRVIDIVRN
jgi:hypothetical protein